MGSIVLNSLLSNCATCGLLCPAARGWGLCPDAPIEVLTDRLGEFAKAFSALVKRAGKLGCDAPSYATVTEYTRVSWLRNTDGSVRLPRRSVGGDRITCVRVSGNAPKFNGWALLATLTPISLPEGAVNLIKSVPGAGELPEIYRTSGTFCDHCTTSRVRKETFVVRHDDGRTMQVGRQCIRDFLGGSSPEHVAALFTFWRSVSELGEEGEGGGWGRRTDSESLIAYLGLVVREVRAEGWLSRKAAREQEKFSSADQAWDRMHPSPMSGRSPQVADEAEILLATSAVAWACDLAGTSDYEHNVRAVALSGSVEPSTLGLAASIWTAYERAMEREVERRQKLSTLAHSEWQGIVDRSTGVLFLHVTKVLDLESEYGVTHLHMMQDERGNAFKWFASSTRLDVGTLYRIEGKVKKHDEYQGIKSTVLTRCTASDPSKAIVSLSQAMQKLAGGDLGLAQVGSDTFEGEAAALLQARALYAQIKGSSAAKALARLDAAVATIATAAGVSS